MDLNIGVKCNSSAESPHNSSSDLNPIHHSANSVRSAHSTIRRTSYFESLIHLLKACVCSGTFAMGDAMKNAGLILGSCGILLLGSICIYNNHMLVNSSIEIKKKLHLTHEPNFPETVELCFQYGPLIFKKLRNFIRYTVKCFIISTQLGFCSIYLVFAGSTLGTILLEHGYQYDTRIYITLAVLPILLTSLIRSLKFLTPLSLISNFLIFSGICMTAYLCCLDLPNLSERKLIADYHNWPLFLGTTIYAFEGISIVIPLRNEMKDPKQFSSFLGVLNVGLLILALLAVGMGFLSYLKFGDEVKGSFTLNLEHGAFSEFIMTTVALGILLTYPIQLHVAVDIIWWDLVASRGPFKHMIRNEIYLRIALVILTYIMAVGVPQLNLFISLIGAMCSTTLALILPALCDISLRACPEEDGCIKAASPLKNILRYSMDGLSLAIAVIACITGTYYSSKTIIEVFWYNKDGSSS